MHLIKPAIALLLALASGIAFGNLRAQDSVLAVRDAGSHLVEGQYRIHADIDYRLSRDALAAMRNGVPLTFEVEAELVQVRDWLPSDSVVKRRRISQLSYDPLTRTYVVRSARDDVHESYSTLYAALNALGRIQDMPLVDQAQLEAGREYEAGVRAALDQQRLPGPLRLLAFWRDGLNLESDWYRWKLAP